MPLAFTPDTAGIRHILETHLDGPYRFIHHALIPYVRVGPAVADAPLTVRGSTALALADAPSVTLRGLADTLDLAVILDGSGVRLREVSGGQRRVAQRALDGIARTQAALPAGGR